MSDRFRWRYRANSLGELTEAQNYIKWDDYTAPWVVFLSNNPIEHEGLRKAFIRQKDVSGKLGVLSRWLVKVANKKGVSDNVIKYYLTCKKRVDDMNPMYRRWIQQKEDRVKTIDSTDFWKLMDLDRKIVDLENSIDYNLLSMRRASILLIEETL